MSIETQQFVCFAERRTKFIRSLIHTNEFFRQGVPFIKHLVPDFTSLFVRSISLKGKEHLEEAQAYVKSGKSLILAMNHQSEADTYVVRHILVKNGLEEFAERLVYIAGLKMLERRSTRPFFAAERSLMVATPGDFKTIEAFLESHQNLSDGEREVVDQYHKSCTLLNMKSGREMIRLSGSGVVIGLYPEGTRTRSELGYIQRAPEQIAGYFKGNRFDVVSLAMRGITKTFPVGKCARFWRRSDVEVVAGERYSASEVWNKRIQSDYPNPERICADLVMARIGLLIPENINPDDLDNYRSISLLNSQVIDRLT